MEEQVTSTSSDNSRGNNSLIAIVAIIVVAVIAFFGFNTLNGNQSKSTNATKQTVQPTKEMNAAPTTNGTKAAMYKDGTYKAAGDYTSPGGKESVEVTLVLQNDKVTDATVIATPAKPQSESYQAMFTDNFKPSVVGKDIETLQLGKISGSSLTPMGFNAAVEKIKSEAKS